MKKNKKIILITGASGFIGRNLYEHLQHKYILLTPMRKELNLLDTQAVDTYFKHNTIDAVINCAIVGGTRPEEQVDSALSENLLIFFNLVRNSGRFKKMIHLGSGAEYDKSKPVIRVKETDFDKTIPTDDYGLFKYICSKYIEKEKNIVSLRVFGLFGRYEDFRYRFISNAITNNLKGLPITIIQNVFFDYMYIDDFVKIIDFFISNEVREKFYNIGTGSKTDLISIANMVNTAAKRKSTIIIKRKGLGNEYTCNNRKLVSEMKKISCTDINEAIRKIYDWYKIQPNLFLHS
jgi:GDP-L-fucose synthase